MKELGKKKETMDYSDSHLKELYQKFEAALQKLRELRWEDPLNRKIEELESQIMTLKDQIKKIERIKKLENQSPICKNENVDLYKSDEKAYNGKEPYGYYEICLPGTKENIGHIGCTPMSSEFNNVFYYIEEQYRGNNMALKAIELFLPYLASQGIESIGIIVSRDNLPSLKTAEKVTKKFPDYTREETTGFITYQFSLLKKEQENTPPKK